MKIDGSTFNTYHISHPLRGEKKWNEGLNYLGTIPIVGTISGACRITYGIMKFAISFVTTPFEGSQVASARIKESGKQIARGFVELIPVIGQAATALIIDRHLIQPSLQKRAVTLIKENQIQEALDTLSEFPSIFGLDNLPSCVTAKEVMDETFETHPLEATKFAEESKGRFTYVTDVPMQGKYGGTIFKKSSSDYTKPDYVKLFNRLIKDGNQTEARAILDKITDAETQQSCRSQLTG